jgi:hypothetical protein
MSHLRDFEHHFEYYGYGYDSYFRYLHYDPQLFAQANLHNPKSASRCVGGRSGRSSVVGSSGEIWDLMVPPFSIAKLVREHNSNFTVFFVRDISIVYNSIHWVNKTIYNV